MLIYNWRMSSLSPSTSWFQNKIQANYPYLWDAIENNVNQQSEFFTSTLRLIFNDPTMDYSIMIQLIYRDIGISVTTNYTTLKQDADALWEYIVKHEDEHAWWLL